MSYIKTALTWVKKEAMSLINPYIECWVCGEWKIRRLTIHHTFYLDDDVIYKDYNTYERTDNEIRYYLDLTKMIKEDSCRFVILCNECHGHIEKLKHFTYQSEYEKYYSELKYYDWEWKKNLGYIAKRTRRFQHLGQFIDDCSPKQMTSEEFFWN